MEGCRFDPGLLRPYIDSRGQKCVTINTGRGPEKRLVAELINNGVSSPVFNATTLRKDEWIQRDQVVLKPRSARTSGFSSIRSC